MSKSTKVITDNDKAFTDNITRVSFHNPSTGVVESTVPVSLDESLNTVSVDTVGLIGGSSLTNSDFTVAYASGTTLTIGNIYTGSTIKVNDISSISVFNAEGALVEKLGRDDLTLVISGSTLTVIGFASDFESDDEFIIGTIIKDNRTKDLGLDIQKVVDQSSKQTSGITLVDETNEDAGTYRTVIDMDEIQYASLQMDITDETITLFGTNRDDADSSADTNWTDITTDIAGSSTITADGMFFLDTNMIMDKLMVKRVAADATNAFKLSVKKSR